MKFPWQVLPVTIDGIFLNRMVTGKKYDLPYVGALDEKHLWAASFNLVTCEPIITLTTRLAYVAMTLSMCFSVTEKFRH